MIYCMDTKARDLAAWAVQSIKALAQDPKFGSIGSVQSFLADESGISLSYIQKFSQGAQTNPTIKTLDMLIYGIKAAKRKVAA